MKDQKIIEKIAEIIYRHDNGMTDKEYEAEYFKSRRVWKTDAPLDTDVM